MLIESVAPPISMTPDGPEWERLDPRYITLQRQTGAMGSMVSALVWLGVVAAVVKWSPLPDAYRWPLFGAWLIAAGLHGWWGQYRPGLNYRHASFRADVDGIEIREGVFHRSVVSIPRSRVQHTDVSQGPWERRHGLGTLQIYTAGVSHAEVSLAGIDHGRALAIRDLLLPRDRVVRT